MAHKKNWAVYHRLFRQAAKLEKSGAEDAALEIYREIVDNYWPIGAEYYEIMATESPRALGVG